MMHGSRSDEEFPLPHEIVLHIFSFLPEESLKEARVVCIEWREVADSTNPHARRRCYFSPVRNGVCRYSLRDWSRAMRWKSSLHGELFVRFKSAYASLYGEEDFEHMLWMGDVGLVFLWAVLHFLSAASSMLPAGIIDSSLLLITLCLMIPLALALSFLHGMATKVDKNSGENRTSTAPWHRKAILFGKWLVLGAVVLCIAWIWLFMGSLSVLIVGWVSSGPVARLILCLSLIMEYYAAGTIIDVYARTSIVPILNGIQCDLLVPLLVASACLALPESVFIAVVLSLLVLRTCPLSVIRQYGGALGLTIARFYSRRRSILSIPIYWADERNYLSWETLAIFGPGVSIELAFSLLFAVFGEPCFVVLSGGGLLFPNSEFPWAHSPLCWWSPVLLANVSAYIWWIAMRLCGAAIVVSMFQRNEMEVKASWKPTAESLLRRLGAAAHNLIGTALTPNLKSAARRKSECLASADVDRVLEECNQETAAYLGPWIVMLLSIAAIVLTKLVVAQQPSIQDMNLQYPVQASMCWWIVRAASCTVGWLLFSVWRKGSSR